MCDRKRTKIEHLDIMFNGMPATDMIVHEIGDDFVFEANVLPANATNKEVEWSSSNPNVVQVYPSGRVNVISYGTATICVKATDGSGVQDSITIAVTPKTYTIIFDGNGSTAGSMSQLNCEYGSNYQLPMNRFNRNNYEFMGWNTCADGSGAAYIDRDTVWNLCEEDGGSITLYAQWLYSGSETIEENDLILVPMKPYRIENLSTGVCIHWYQTEGAVQYGIWRSENGKNGTYKHLATTHSLYYTDESVKSGRTYYYKISVYDTANNKYGEKSIEIGIKFLETPKVSSGENITTGIKLKWSKVAGASGYIVYQKNDSNNAKWKKIATIAGGSKVTYTDKSIKKKNGNIYRYRVQAFNGTAISGYQSDTLITRLTTPKIKSAKKVSRNSLKCTWSKTSKITGYEVRLMTGSKVYKIYKIKNTKTVSKTIKKLTKGKKYKIQIRTYKKIKGGRTFYSAWSASKSVTIKK